VGKHHSNPQYFKEKNYKAQYLKSKINKNNFEKINAKKKTDER